MPVEDTEVGRGTKVHHPVNIYGAEIGEDCTIGAFVEIQRGVVIGDRCKIEPYAFIPSGVTIGDEVFIGPHACFTNDRYPRAVGDWDLVETRVGDGASIGAGAVVLPGCHIGVGALVAAGAVVTKELGWHEVVVGNPARRMTGPASSRAPLRREDVWRL